MRHLSIPLILGALLLSSCGERRQEQVDTKNDIITTTRPVEGGVFMDNEDVIYDESFGGSEASEMQAEEERVTPRSYDRKTYNEKQFSDDASDYPIDKSDRGETYEEKQLNR